MKQTLLLIICCIVSGVSFAQIQTGNALVGGTLGAGIDRPQNPNFATSSFTVKPVVGKFISDNWLIGIKGEYRMQKQNYSSTSMYNVGGGQTHYISLSNPKTQIITIGPMARYYREVMPKLYGFGESSVGYGLMNRQHTYSSYTVNQYGEQSKRTESSGNVKTNHVYGDMSLGIAFFPATKLGIELKTNIIQYKHGIGNGPEQDPITFSNYPNTERNLSVNLTLATTSIGLGYYF